MWKRVWNDNQAIVKKLWGKNETLELNKYASFLKKFFDQSKYELYANRHHRRPFFKEKNYVELVH